MNTDSIEKQVLLRVPRSRAWRAISDSTEFGAWFGMRFNGPFAAGASMKGTIVPTVVDGEIAKKQEKYNGTPFEIEIEQIEPQHLFSFRWHPGGVDPNYDYSVEPMTLVTFSLAEAPEGTLLTVTETGFDSIPLARRANAFKMNEQGWNGVSKLIEAYVERTP